uniref:Uncharacterized protein n=1 Tax=viral metagenome TaxID=1070528 RepID=A0A6M3L266_9ZZZZ
MDYNNGYGAMIPSDATGYDAPQLPQQNPAQRQLSLVSADLYSYHRWPQAAGLPFNDFPVFLTPVGVAGQGYAIPLSELQTNIRVSGMLPGGVSWIIDALGVDLVPGNNPVDNVTFLRNTWVDFIRGQSRQTLGPARFFPGGSGIAGVASTTLPMTDLRELSNGAPSYAAMRRLTVPIELPPQEQFSFEFRIRGHNAAALPLVADFVAGIRLVGRRTEATQL